MSIESNKPPDDVATQADQRLVHAMLLHLHEPAAQREKRVNRLMESIRAIDTGQPESAEPRRTMRLTTWTRRGLAAAALVLIAIGIWILVTPSNTALASVSDIINAIGRPGDRAFHIQMEDLPEPPGRAPPDDHGPVPKPGLDDATLYLRDGKQYVLKRHDPNGGAIFDGFDGRQSWRVRKGVVAEIKEGPGAGGIPMPPIMADVPFSDLHGTIARIESDYTVERLDHAAFGAGGEVLRHVLVRRKSREVKGPEAIEIWADPKTAMPRRIIFDRAKVQGNRAPCRITLDLLSESPLPADWFSPAAHVGSGSASPRLLPK